MFLAGCDYEVPLSQTASAPADSVLAGSWLEQNEDELYRMNIQISENEYVVAYGEAEEAPLLFKGFEVRAAGLNLIQLELQNAEKEKYLFVKYELTADRLTVYRLNPDVVSAQCQSTEELLNDIDVHRQNPFLFEEPLKFTRSVQQ
jgi:hypothetical protein